MRRIALSGLALALTLGSASLVAAQQPAQGQAPAAQQQHQWGRRGQRNGLRNLRRQLFKDVKLTDQQKAQIKAINQKYRAQAHQGTLTLAGSGPDGSTFVVELPAPAGGVNPTESPAGQPLPR